MGRMLVAVVAAVLAVGLAQPADAEAAPTKAEVKLLRKINQTRSAHGLRSLRTGPVLQRRAHRWARYLLRRDAFYHGRIASGVRENIGWVTCRRRWAGALVRMWLASPVHRGNLLARGISRAGVGVAKGPWRGYGCVRIAVTRFR